jgi:hypothetical protein
MKRLFLALTAAFLPLLACGQEIFAPARSTTDRFPVKVERIVEAPAPAGETYSVRMILTAKSAAFSGSSSVSRGGSSSSSGTWIVTLPPEQFDALLAIFAKYEQWQKIAAEKNVKSFNKFIGTINRQDIEFEWNREEKTARLSGFQNFRDADVHGIRELIKQYPEAKAELERLTAEKVKEAEMFK